MDRLNAAATGRRNAPLVMASACGAPSADGDALLDLERIDELRDLLGAPRVTQLLDLLSRELAQRPARIRVLTQRSDLHGARAEAHSLRGAASNLGVVALSRVAAAIEATHSLEEISRHLPALERLATRTFDAIAELR